MVGARTVRYPAQPEAHHTRHTLTLTRKNARQADQVRPFKLTRSYTDSCPGSVLVECGRTRVLCTVSIQEQVPQWMYGKPGGWLTAEYSMLPAASAPRKPRDGRSGRPIDGRSYEIQRLIGRALRSVMDLSVLPELTLWIDCDVLSADGGTRTASINGAAVALHDALLFLEEQRKLRQWPLKGLVSAISVGMLNGTIVADMDYDEDSAADVDLTLVTAADGKLVEVAGAAERRTFTAEQFTGMLNLGQTACSKILELQKKTLGI